MPTCLACGAPGMAPHLRPRAGAGASFAPDTAAYGAALGAIWRCAACGHGQVEPMPSASALAAAYAGEEEVVAGEQSGLRATAAAALDAIERALGGAPGRLLDLGCWTGAALLEARARGWEVAGVEPSAAAAAVARAHGLHVVEGAVPGVLGRLGGGWDAVVLADVLEHLPEPVAALEAVAGVLRPGGVVWLALPDFGSRVARRLGRHWWSVLPTHVQYFTRASVQAALGRAGLRAEHVRTAPKAFTVGYYAGRLGGYAPALGRAAVAGVTAAGLAGRLWAPDFRDRMAVLARTPA